MPPSGLRAARAAFLTVGEASGVRAGLRVGRESCFADDGV
jgi:hypothetical protein